MSTHLLYVVGHNERGQLGLKYDVDGVVNKLTNWNVFNQDVLVTNIITGEKHTIFGDKNGYYLVAGDNGKGECGVANTIDSNDFIQECTQMTYFNDNNIKIKRVCSSVGGSHNTFWITDKNELYGNGINKNSQLGLGNNDNTDKFEPKRIEGLQNVMIVKGGDYHNIAICLGLNITYIAIIINHWIKLSKINTYIPNDIIIIFKKYHSHKYIVYSTGEPNNHCKYNQDGHGSSVTLDRCNWNIIKELEDKNIMSVSCGSDYSLFLTQSGQIWGCGNNRNGELGLGHHRIGIDPPVLIPFFLNNKIIITDIQSGEGHNLALDSCHNVYSWGYNYSGQCGDGTEISIIVPKMNVYLAEYNIITIQCGFSHSYAKSDNGQHFLFGYNGYNQCSLIESDANKIVIPCCINKVFAEQTNGEKIEDIYLGFCNTFIITKENKEEMKREWKCTFCDLINNEQRTQCQACFGNR